MGAGEPLSGVDVKTFSFTQLTKWTTGIKSTSRERNILPGSNFVLCGEFWEC